MFLHMFPGKIRHVGHGVIFGRGDDMFAQDRISRVQVRVVCLPDELRVFVYSTQFSLPQ